MASGRERTHVEQKFQTFTGTLKTGNVIAPITDGRLNTDQITFTAGGTQYTGKVKGSAMEGTSKAGGTEAKWQATRSRSDKARSGDLDHALAAVFAGQQADQRARRVFQAVDHVLLDLELAGRHPGLQVGERPCRARRRSP